jgi:hypothetical protein
MVESEKLVQSVFQWLAVAKRPLSLSELREAVAVQPCEKELQTEELTNNFRRIVSWCMNLVVLDEEDDIVQFAHHSVRSFFLETSDHTFEDFHFKLSDADHRAGEVCVTYLNFNCFKAQLVKTCSATKLKDQILISPEAILQSSLSSGLNRTVSSSWLKFGGL